FSNVPVPLDLHTLSLHDALPMVSRLSLDHRPLLTHPACWFGLLRLLASLSDRASRSLIFDRLLDAHGRLTFFLFSARVNAEWKPDWKSTRLNSSHVKNSYAVFCL